MYVHHAGFDVRVLDSWTITLKQNVTFQEWMHLEKIRLLSNLKWSPIGHYLLAQYLAKRVKWLDHYYKTKCDVSREDAP